MQAMCIYVDTRTVKIVSSMSQNIMLVKLAVRYEELGIHLSFIHQLVPEYPSQCPKHLDNQECPFSDGVPVTILIAREYS